MNRNVVLRSLLVLVVVALTVLTVPLQTVAVDPGIQNFRLPFDGGPFGISQGPRCVCEDPNICSHNSGQGARNTEAIDFSMSTGTNIYAVEGGTVDWGSTGNPGNGELYIRHSNGYASVYAHLSSKEVADGVAVSKGDLIGKSGSTNANAPHLHFSVVKDSDSVAVPIYDMPGLWWEPGLAPYPQQGTCTIDGTNDGTGQWPPANNCSIQPGAESGFRQNAFQEAYLRNDGQAGIGCAENPAHEQGSVWLQNFSSGSMGGCAIIYNLLQNQAHGVCNPFIGAYFNTPNWWETLGEATTEKMSAGASVNSSGHLVGFQEGDIYNANGNPNAYVVKNPFMYVYSTIGGSSSSACGWPTDHEVTAWPSPDSTGRGQRFEYCTMYLIDGWGLPIVVKGAIEDAFDQVGGTSTVGFPLAGEGTAAMSPQGTNGVWQPFEEGNVYYSSAHGAYAVTGLFYDYHEYTFSEGGTASPLGFPTSNQFSWYDFVKQNFEGGEVVCYTTPGACFMVAVGTTEPDFTPPDTSFTLTSASCTNSGPVTFGFTGSDNTTDTENLVYATRIDSGAWSEFDGGTSKMLNGLSHGAHTFDVKARDEWLNEDESPASHPFTVDAIPPETTVDLTGTAGNNGWYRSTVSVELSATDTGCGSGSIQTWYSINGGPDQSYSGGTINFPNEGVYTLDVYSVDGVGNIETLQSFEIKIDWTPPEVSGTATGPRDTNGVFRGDVTVDGIATDNLSGVDVEEMSLDGGSSWQSLSQMVLTGNGTGRVFYRATDVAGNASDVLDSGQIIINQYVVFANQTGESLLVDGTTSILVDGDVHTNGTANFIYNSWSTFDGAVSAVGSVTANQTNTGLTIISTQAGASSVPMLDYPIAMYQSLCDVVHSGNLVIDSVAQGMEGIHCVSGNLDLRSVLLTGSVTFVVNGDITDVMVGSDLQTNDPYNGVMMIAGGDILLQGNAYDLLGLIYAPNGTITISSNDVRITGSIVAQSVVFDGTGSGFELSYDAAFASDTFVLPLTESVFWQPSEQQWPTPTPTPTGQPSPTPTATPSPTSTPTPTPTPTATPNGGDVLYLSTDNDEEVGSFEWDEEDIVTHNPTSESWAMLFDASDVGADNVDALHILSDGSILVSFDWSVSLSGLGSVGKEDIVKFTPSQTGETTSGTWSWYLDGSDVGLSSRDINALHVLPDGKIVVSFDGSFTLTGPGSIRLEDLVVFTPTQLGQTTTGTWAWYVDGSDVDLEEDIDGLWIADNGDIYLSTSSSWDELSIDADDEDIFVCTNPTIGSNSSCTFGSSVFWDGSAHDMTGDVDALYIDPD